VTDSSLCAERYRPQFHFTARKNWINDPNGCVFCHGEYHLFFQHNPLGLEWGNMTWGHAVSPDLVHWSQLPNAIEPYDRGTIFSGSAVLDSGNSSGFGCGQTPPLVAAFTHARRPFGQALAFSLDRGRSWQLHEGGRHVVLNQGLDPGERDPRVFWHAPTGRWVMVLWVQRGRARFFTSGDLRQWAHAGDFQGEGFYECPDMFELPVDGDPGHTRWVLHDAAFHYWIGSFDGRCFSAESGPLPGDLGANFYAAQTWSNLPGRVVQIAWMRDGRYPAMPFNQQMSIPCELSLRTTPDGVRLCRMPVAELEGLRISRDGLWGVTLKAGEDRALGAAGDLFDITAEIEPSPGAAWGLRLHQTEIIWSDQRLHCLGRQAPVPVREGVVRLRVLVDRTSLELFANAGEVAMSSCFLPPEVTGVVHCFVSAGQVRVRSLGVHRLRSVFSD
jgi:sucrose-6-phosphate hydrolase SacC (GH32 family)